MSNPVTCPSCGTEGTPEDGNFESNAGPEGAAYALDYRKDLSYRCTACGDTFDVERCDSCKHPHADAELWDNDGICQDCAEGEY